MVVFFILRDQTKYHDFSSLRALCYHLFCPYAVVSVGWVFCPSVTSFHYLCAWLWSGLSPINCFWISLLFLVAIIWCLSFHFISAWCLWLVFIFSASHCRWWLGKDRNNSSFRQNKEQWFILTQLPSAWLLAKVVSHWWFLLILTLLSSWFSALRKAVLCWWGSFPHCLLREIFPAFYF